MRATIPKAFQPYVLSQLTKAFQMYDVNQPNRFYGNASPTVKVSARASLERAS